MSGMLGKPTFLAITIISFVTSVILLSPLIATKSLGLFSFNINGEFTGWIKQCIRTKLVNSNNNNDNNSSVTGAITNPIFALDNARAYCTQLAQAYINNNHLTTQNQPSSSLATVPPTAYQYQNPSSYGYQQQPQATNNAVGPTPQYPYQSPNQYPYQQQPYPYTNQQQQQSPTTNNVAPYQNLYPYQQPQQLPQSQSYSLGAGNNPSQYPYRQQLPQQQNQSSALATNSSQQQSSQSLMSTSQPSQSNLIIVTHVNSTGGSNNDVNGADNCTQVVENMYTNPDGYTYVFHYMKGSQSGVTLTLQPGGFSVFELNNNIKTGNPPLDQSTYQIAYSGDCRTVKSNTGGTTYGYGTINPGETKTCTVTLSVHK